MKMNERRKNDDLILEIIKGLDKKCDGIMGRFDTFSERVGNELDARKEWQDRADGKIWGVSSMLAGFSVLIGWLLR